MSDDKSTMIQKRAIKIAKEYIDEHVQGLDDEMLKQLSKSIILTSAVIAGRLLAEYDDNKEKGNI